MAANYATSAFVATIASGANVFVDAGARRDSVTDAALIAQFPTNFTTTVPAAGVGNVTGVLAGYLAVYPAGPQVT